MIKAANDIIIVELQYRPKTSGGLIIPSSIKAEPQSYGKVISIGPDVKDENIKENCMIVFHPRAGQDMVLKNIIYKAVKYPEVYGVIEDPDLQEGLFTMTITGGNEGENKITPVTTIVKGI